MSCGCGTKACTCNLFGSMQGCLDSVLGVRDCIGAKLHDVFIMERRWTGERPGDGKATETTTQILPTPQIKDYSHNLRLTEGGAIRQGDIILKGISKKSYPSEADLDCSTSKRNIEKYYLIGERLYTVIHIREDYLTWDVHLRKRSDETRGGK